MEKNTPHDQQGIYSDRGHRQIFLEYLNRGWLMFGIVTLIVLPFFPGLRSQIIFLAAITLPAYPVVRFLNRSGRTLLARVLFTLTVNFGFYGLFLLLAGERGPEEAFRTEVTVWRLMGLAVRFAGALINKWAALALALLNSVLLIGTRLVLAPKAEPRPSAMVFWWMMAIIIWLYERTLQQAFAQAWKELAERQRVNDQLQESEKRYRLLAENASDVIWTMDMDLRSTYTSPSVKRLRGYEAEDTMAQPLQHALTPASFEAVTRALEEELAAEKLPEKDLTRSRTLELEVMHRDGSTVWVESTMTFLRGPDGRPVEILGVNRDLTERKRAEDNIIRQLQRLEALHQIDMVITSGLDMNVGLNLLLEKMLPLLSVDAALILLIDPPSRFLNYAAGRGFQSDAIRGTRVQIGHGYAGRAALEQHTVHVSDLTRTSMDQARLLTLAQENFVSYYAIPLLSKGRVNGVLEIFHRAPFQPDREWQDFAETMANQAAILIEDTQLFSNLQRSNLELSVAYDATIEGWSRAMDLRDKETEGHTRRVTELSLRLARAMNIPEADLIHIRRGGLLHDIGKLGVPDNILLKADELTDEEWEKMRKHPQSAYEMLSSIRYLQPA